MGRPPWGRCEPFVATYQLAGFRVRSAVPLPSLQCGAGHAARVALVVSEAARTPARRIRRFRHRWEDEAGRAVLSLARNQDGYLLRVPRKCDFALSPDATQVEVRPLRELTVERLEHLLVDQVLPRCLAHQGELVVHAAGIAFPDGGALLVGESGYGKSTLAAAAMRAGLVVLSDDCLFLRVGEGRVSMRASYPGLRLWRDSFDAVAPTPDPGTVLPSYGDKRRVRLLPDSGVLHDAELRVIYLLGDPEDSASEVRFTRLSAADASVRVILQCFQLDVVDRERSGRLLAQVADVLTRVPAFRLDFPRRFDLVAHVVDAIGEHRASLPFAGAS